MQLWRGASLYHQDGAPVPILDKIELYFVSAPLPAPFSPSWVPGLTRTP